VLHTGRPSACNLCHLDQTLDWTNRKLAEWYEHEKVPLDGEHASLSEAGSLLLRGDAAQRVLVAWSAAWQPAQAASGVDWIAPLLAPLLEDPSPVIRLVASRSLATIQPGYAQDYDFVGSPHERKAARKQVISAWNELPRAKRESLPTRVFIKAGGESDEELIQRFVNERDDRGLLMMAE
jgi:hypothetical protein